MPGTRAVPPSTISMTATIPSCCRGDAGPSSSSSPPPARGSLPTGFASGRSTGRPSRPRIRNTSPAAGRRSINLALSRQARNRPDAHSLLACNGADALACGAGRADRLDLGCVIRGCRPPKSRPVGLCPRQAGHDTFADNGAFKLGEHAEHLKHRAAGRRGLASCDARQQPRVALCCMFSGWTRCTINGCLRYGEIGENRP